MSLPFRPFIDAIGTKLAPILTVPAVIVKPLLHVSVDAHVIVLDVNKPEFEIDEDDKPLLHVIELDVNAPVFVIDPDVRAPVLVIVFDDKAPVLLIVFDDNVLSVDEDARILSDCRAFETKAFLLNVCGTILFGNSIDGNYYIYICIRKLFL